MTISRQALFGKLSPVMFKALENATAFCKLRGNSHVELAHWFHQLLNGADNDLLRLIQHLGLDRPQMERDINAALSSLPAGATSISDFSSHLLDVVERAWVHSTLAFGDSTIRGGYLVAAMAGQPDLRRILLNLSPAFQALPPENAAGVIAPALTGSPEAGQGSADGSRLAGAEGVEEAAAPGGDSGLSKYCSDLTERARSGQLDPVIGRELEIRAMIDILLRRRQNNPLLTGDAGVGKTAVVEGLALALARGEVPEALKNMRLLGLDVGSLLAGASLKGEFEARLRNLIEEAGKSPEPVILFVDEIHTLVGAGGNQGTGDAANLLKPALARGALRTIGATTWSEYKRHIEKDAALARRFQVLQIHEPDEISGVEMVRGLTDTFTRHHEVLILDEAVRAAVRLSARYIPSRQLPDKAISLLDTAASRVTLSLSSPPPEVEHARRRLAAKQVEYDLMSRELKLSASPENRAAEFQELAEELRRAEEQLAGVEAEWNRQTELVRAMGRERALLNETEDEDQARLSRETLKNLEAELSGSDSMVFPAVDALAVAAIVADWTGIPVGRMMSDDLRTVAELPQIMGRRIIGQDHALEVLARRIQTARAQLTDPDKPVGVFLLVGPSGVGKTETALALAEALYGGEQNLITVNMSEFQESHTISTLKGAPPGYVGYGEGGVLTEAVRRRPHSVILLDEIEKAHRDVYEVFYQVFDKGWMEDGEGRYIDFKNTIILLTTNIGSEVSDALCADPELKPEPEALAEALLPELRRVFPAAFLGRLNLTPYYPLSQNNMVAIVDMHLNRVAGRLRENHSLELTVAPGVKERIIDRCALMETGARLVISYIDQNILPEISRFWLGAGSAASGELKTLRLALESDRIICQAED